MRVLVLGSGGRENALCWKLAESKLLTKLWCAPGNPGIGDTGIMWGARPPGEEVECVDISATATTQIIEFCVLNRIDLVIPGPESAIVNGLADKLAQYGIACCAPSALASQLESSKEFTKKLCDDMGIPTASWKIIHNVRDSIKHMRTLFLTNDTIVIKANGLAGGKGVVIVNNEDDAEDALAEIMVERIHGDAGKSVIFEEYLEGTEASVFAICNGTDAVYFGSAQDYKKRYDNDEGPNTGGMGAVSPAPAMTDEMLEKTWQTIILPTLDEMKRRGMPYKGVLFAGIMIVDNTPILIEYNIRFGDPECQTLMARTKFDLLDLLYQAATGGSMGTVEMSDQTAVSVVMVSPGYPQAPETGSIIRVKPEPIDNSQETIERSLEDLDIFHSGTKIVDNEFVAAGGRVLTVTAVGKDVTEARQFAYDLIEQIDWPEGEYRKDIGKS